MYTNGPKEDFLQCSMCFRQIYILNSTQTHVIDRPTVACLLQVEYGRKLCICNSLVESHICACLCASLTHNSLRKVLKYLPLEEEQQTEQTQNMTTLFLLNQHTFIPFECLQSFIDWACNTRRWNVQVEIKMFPQYTCMHCSQAASCLICFMNDGGNMGHKTRTDVFFLKCLKVSDHICRLQPTCHTQHHIGFILGEKTCERVVSDWQLNCCSIWNFYKREKVWELSNVLL